MRAKAPPCDGPRNHANGSRGRTQAHDGPGPVCTAGSTEVDDRIRQEAETICQALIVAKLSAVIGAVPHERTASRAGPCERDRLL